MKRQYKAFFGERAKGMAGQKQRQYKDCLRKVMYKNFEME
jgi:hypothetical protein